MDPALNLFFGEILETLVCLILILAAACACTPLSAAPAAAPTQAVLATVTPVPTLSPTPTSTPAPSPTPVAWTLAQLKNASYTLEELGPVTLVDGKFSLEVKDARGPYKANGMLIERFATGDLNGDGLADAAVILAVNTGGSGTFHTLFVLLSQQGQAARQYLGDRIVEKQVTIADGKITLDILRQGPKDGLCCPSEHAILTYQYRNGALEKLSDQVVPAAPAMVYPNQITIDAPVLNAAVNNPFKVQGKTSQMPFEKNLVYRVYDAAGQKILESFITVVGDFSGPGTFAAMIQLPAGYHGPARVEISDMDAASGQTRGLASVIVNVL